MRVSRQRDEAVPRVEMGRRVVFGVHEDREAVDLWDAAQTIKDV